MVYVHVPFCRSFCTYCDFYSETACTAANIDGYVSGICREAAARQEEIASTLGTDTLYIGGGTPSVLPLSALEKIVAAVSRAGAGAGRRWPPSHRPTLPGKMPPGPCTCTADCFEEFTVEVNPDDIVKKGPEYVRGLLSLGVNRISMGVQSLDDGILRWMNRRHDSAEALEAFRLLRSCGVENISVDVIFGINGLENEVLEDTLDSLTALSPEHISAYQLSVEEGGTLSGMIESGQYSEAPEEQCREQYELICRILKGKGYGHYEISNWARPGYESEHNSAYWKRVPYVGLGPAAHSFLIRDGKQIRSWNSETLSGWTSEEEILSEAEIREEEVMLGMRMARNLPADEREWFIADTLISEKLDSLEG